MKLILLIVIIFVFGLIGYLVKCKYIDQKEMLIFLEDFIIYLKTNISIYKNNIEEIVNSYKINLNGKNAKFCNFFLKNNNLTTFNEKLITNRIYNKNLQNYLIIYFFRLGKETVDYEIQNANKILELIKTNISVTEEEIRLKGDLYFKIWLSIGIAVSIILW